MLQIAGGILLAIAIIIVLRLVGSRIAVSLHWHKEKKDREAARKEEREQEIAAQEKRLKEKGEI